MSFRIPRLDIEVRIVTKFGENRPLQSCRKVARITTHKKPRAPRDSSQPHFPQNSANVVTPWHVHVYWIWPGSAALCRTYFRKIFWHKKSLQYRLSAYNYIISKLCSNLTVRLQYLHQRAKSPHLCRYEI